MANMFMLFIRNGDLYKVLETPSRKCCSSLEHIITCEAPEAAVAKLKPIVSYTEKASWGNKTGNGHR